MLLGVEHRRSLDHRRKVHHMLLQEHRSPRRELQHSGDDVHRRSHLSNKIKNQSVAWRGWIKYPWHWQ